jgi:hypothetical protein
VLEVGEFYGRFERIVWTYNKPQFVNLNMRGNTSGYAQMPKMYGVEGTGKYYNIRLIRF